MAKCIRPIDLPKVDYPIPCGTCGFCLQNRKRDWQFRIANELKIAETALFVTLTYSDEYVPVKNGQDVLDKEDLQKFFKRLRKRHNAHHTTQIRYYAVGEYGTQYKRPHYHILLFNAYAEDVEKAWPLGFVKFDPVEMGSVGYVVGYVSSIDNESVTRGVPKQFSVMSKRPAIGFAYLSTHSAWHLSNRANYTQVNGIRGRLPRYYKNKIFTSDQLKDLADNGVLAWEKNALALRKQYQNLGHRDPDRALREQELKHESTIYQNILNTKKQL